MRDLSERVEGFTAKGSLGFLVRRAQKLMSQQAEQVFDGRELTLSQWIVLALIDDGSVVTPGEAAGILGHNSGATTRLIDHLEGQGLLERRREPGDRRLVSLVLTPAGRSMAKAWGAKMAGFFDDLLAEFSPAEVETLINLMGRLVDRLEARDTS
jgi:DNA-binding MarR family transcriptional regulator